MKLITLLLAASIGLSSIQLAEAKNKPQHVSQRKGKKAKKAKKYKPGKYKAAKQKKPKKAKWGVKS